MLSSLGISMSNSTVEMASRILSLATPLLAVLVLQHRTGNLLVLASLPAPLAGIVFAVILVMLGIIGVREPMEFIYFQF
jgi:hypothetical protein